MQGKSRVALRARVVTSGMLGLSWNFIPERCIDGSTCQLCVKGDQDRGFLRTLLHSTLAFVVIWLHDGSIAVRSHQVMRNVNVSWCSDCHS